MLKLTHRFFFAGPQCAMALIRYEHCFFVVVFLQGFLNWKQLLWWKCCLKCRRRFDLCMFVKIPGRPNQIQIMRKLCRYKHNRPPKRKTLSMPSEKRMTLNEKKEPRFKRKCENLPENVRSLRVFALEKFCGLSFIFLISWVFFFCMSMLKKIFFFNSGVKFH